MSLPQAKFKDIIQTLQTLNPQRNPSLCVIRHMRCAYALCTRAFLGLSETRNNLIIRVINCLKVKVFVGHYYIFVYYIFVHLVLKYLQLNPFTAKRRRRAVLANCEKYMVLKGKSLNCYFFLLLKNPFFYHNLLALIS